MGKKKRLPDDEAAERRLQGAITDALGAVVGAWGRRDLPPDDPDPDTFVLEIQGDQVSAVGADGISAAARQSDIRLRRRLVQLEHVSRRILDNRTTTPRRRALAERLLQEVLTARAVWERTGERPDARMGDFERMAGTLDRLTLLPLAGRGARFTGGKQSKGELWEVMFELVRATEPPKRHWPVVLRDVAASPRLTAARLKDYVLTYEEPPGCPHRPLSPQAFRGKLANVRRAVRQEAASKNS